MDERPVSAAVAKALAPHGRLRAAINFGNTQLAQADPATGDAKGISVALARRLAARLGLELELVRYTTAGNVVEALGRDEWDIGFLAVDPARAERIDFSPPYIVIEGSFAVHETSSIRTVGEVDRPGVSISLTRGSGYDLFLTRTIKAAALVRSATVDEALDAFAAGKCDVLASIKHSLLLYARRTPGMRLLEPSFMSIGHAMAVPKGRTEASAYMNGFIDEIRASNFVAENMGDAADEAR
ncbi:MAG: transporter substrate-binding domain-containing protein [Pseudolabrys sp.]